MEMNEWIQKIVDRKKDFDQKEEKFKERMNQINITIAEIRVELIKNEQTKGSNIQPSRNQNEWVVNILGKQVTFNENEIEQEQSQSVCSLKEAIIKIIDRKLVW